MAQGKEEIKFKEIRALGTEIHVIATRTDDKRKTDDGRQTEDGRRTIFHIYEFCRA